MKYIYGQKVTRFRRRLTSLIASAAILANSMGVAVPIFLTQRAFAATTITVCDSGCSYTTIPDAMLAATDGDVIQVSSNQTITNTVLVNKSVNITGVGSITINTSGSNQVFRALANGASISGFDFVKTDIANQDFIGIQANNVHIENNTFNGNWNIGDASTIRALVVSTSTGLTVSDNTFQNIRQPAYINDNTSGTITNNHLTNSKGWVAVSNTNLVFTGNSWGNNVLDIALIPGGTNNYSDATIVQMSDDNNNAVVENQFGTKKLSDVYVAPAPNGNIGDEGSKWNPYTSFSSVVARAVEGATVHIADGSYTLTSQVAVSKKLHFKGSGGANISTNGSTKIFLITASGSSIDKINITKTDNADQNIIGIQANNVSVTNSNFVAQYTLAANAGTSRALEISTSTGTNLQGNSFNNIRQPAYINDNATGTISNNTVNETRGWVIVANTNFNFNGNNFGTNAVDIAIIPGTPNNYPCDVMATIKVNNDNATIDNQALSIPCINPPANTVAVVTEIDTQGWVGASETGSGNSAFTSGPASPPIGTGSLNLQINNNSDGYVYARSGYAGTRLDNIATLSYSSYKSSGSPAVAPALQINIDNDVTDTDTGWKGRLVYEPYLANGGSTPSGTWSDWNTKNGAGWFFSNGGLATTSGCAMATPCTFTEVLEAFPNAGINQSQGLIMFKVGSGWTTGFNGNIDNFTIATGSINTTYDFEPLSNTAPSISFEAPTPTDGSTVSGSITPHVLAIDDYGMSSYYIRLWKGSFESGPANLVSNNCWSAPGGFNLGTSQDVTCPAIDTTALEDGTYVLSAQFLDGNNAWAQQLRTFTIDNTSPGEPSATFTADSTGENVPDGGNTNSQHFTFSLNASTDTTRYQLKYWNDISGSPFKESNPWNPSDLSGYSPTLGIYKDNFTQGPGTHYFAFSACDAVGNCSNYSAPFVVTYDVDAPDTPAHVSPSDNAVQNFNDFYFEWTDVTDAVEYEFQSASSAATDSSGALTTGVWNNKVNGGSDRNYLTDSSIHSYGANGTWYWQVRAVDAAGNKSAWTSPWKMTIDMTAPSIPSILTPTNEQSFNSTPILNKWTAATDAYGVAAYQIAYRYDDGHSFGGSTCLGEEIDGQAVGGCRDTSSTQRNHIPGLIEQGGVTIWVRAVDAAGNKSAWSTPVHYYYDAIPPTAPTISMSESSGDVIISGYTNSYSVITSWPAVDGADGYQYQYSNSIPGDTYNAPNYYEVLGASTSIAGVFNRGEGLHHVRVRAYDNAGNWSDWSNTLNIVFDVTNPVVTSDLMSGSVLSGSVTMNEFISDANPDRCKLRIFLPDNSAMPYASTETPYPGCDFTVDTTTLADGAYVAKFTGWDKAGNTVVLNVPFSVDNTAPVVTINPLVASINTTPVITGTIDDPAAVVKLSIDGGPLNEAVNNGNGTWTYTVATPFAPGAHTITVSAIDAIGNAANPEPTVSYTVNTPQAVAGVSTDTPNGNASENSDDNPNPVAFRNAAARGNTGGNGSVLAAETDNPNNEDLNRDEAQSEVNEARTLAAGDENSEPSDNSTAGCGKFMGICWYWWIPIAIAILGTIYYLTSRRVDEK